MAETGNNVIIAENKDLEGRFFKIKLQSAHSLLKEKLQKREETWAPNLKSLFVPPRYQVKLSSSTHLVYKGPTVVEIPENTYTSLEITKSLELSGEYIRACQNADMDGPCIQFETKDLNPKKSITNMPFNPKSLYIPNGWKVHEINGEYRTINRKSGVSKRVVQYVDIKGPITLGNICGESTQVVELSGFTQIGPLKNEIKICSRKNFAGWCDYIDNKVIGTIIHGCEWKTIESYNVPKSAILEVTVPKSWWKLFSTDPVLTKVGPTRSLNADLAPIDIQYKVDDKKRKKL